MTDSINCRPDFRRLSPVRCPGRGDKPDLCAVGRRPEKYGRLVFQTSPTSWLVEQTWLVRYDRSDSPSTLSQLLRICVAELVFARDPAPADPPRKGWLRR